MLYMKGVVLGKLSNYVCLYKNTIVYINRENYVVKSYYLITLSAILYMNLVIGLFYIRTLSVFNNLIEKQLSCGQEEDTAVVSDTTDDLWFLNEAESEQVSVEMKEAALEQGSDSESPQEEEEQVRDSKADKEVKNPTTPSLFIIDMLI